jgi:hypothetical protein
MSIISYFDNRMDKFEWYALVVRGCGGYRLNRVVRKPHIPPLWAVNFPWLAFKRKGGVDLKELFYEAE